MKLKISKYLIILFTVILSGNISAQIYEDIPLNKDSIIQNRFNKGNYYFGGGIGGTIDIKSPGFQVTRWSVAEVSSIGYFIKDKSLILLQSGFLYETETTENDWRFLSLHSLIYRHYLKPKKITFFAEGAIDYVNFYEEVTIQHQLPAKWFHVGMITPGVGADIQIYKFSLSLTLKYHIPLLYKEEATQYLSFEAQKKPDYIFGIFFTL